MTHEQNVDFVLRTVEERDIRFVQFWFTDLLGNLKSFAISPEDLEEAFEEGIGFDGFAVDGFAPLEESDMLAFPDPTTFQLLPWRPTERGAARVICSVRTPGGEEFEGDSRSCLQRVFRATEEKGYLFMVGPELEYFYFDGPTMPAAVPIDTAGYFDLTPSDFARDLRRDTTLTLEKMSIPVEYSYHGMAPSQNGISLRYAEGVTSADNIVTARLAIKEVAYENGLFASFMPKPFTGQAGSSMFVFESLFDHEGNNVFWADDEPGSLHLSELAKHYIAGILRYAPEFCLLSNPTVNSYKRLTASGEVPCYSTWGRKNRSALVRLPLHKPGKKSSTRIELRLPDPAANPYLMLAATLAAGIEGVRQELPLQDEYTTEDARATEAEMSARGIKRLPRDLGEAIEVFAESKLMRQVLGDHIFDFYLTEKRAEWEEYCSTVTLWEQERSYAGF